MKTVFEKFITYLKQAIYLLQKTGRAASASAFKSLQINRLNQSVFRLYSTVFSVAFAIVNKSEIYPQDAE